MYPQLQSHPEHDFLGSRARVLAASEQTAGTLGLVDMVYVPPGDMSPLHVHHSHDEGFCVLEGEVSLYMPGRRIDATTGDFVFAPRGVPHTYRVGTAPARWLVTSTPAGFEQFVVAVAELGDKDPQTLAAVAAKHDIEILGPPGTLP